VRMSTSREAPMKLEMILAYYREKSYIRSYGNFTIDSISLWGISYFQELNSMTRWAMDFTRNLSESLLTVGIQKQINNKGTIIKGKCSVKQSEQIDWRLGVSLKHILTPNVTAIIGTDILPNSLFPQSFIYSTENHQEQI